jgi:acetyl-CoA C-acetyltransferase
MQERRRQPVLVGFAQVSDRTSAPEAALTPLDLLERAARLSLAHTGALPQKLLETIDGLGVVRAFGDSAPMFRPAFWGYEALPRALAGRLGVVPKRLLYPQAGGNTPQLLVSLLGEAIVQGTINAALIVGAEAQRTQALAIKRGIALPWFDAEADKRPALEVEAVGDPRPGVTRHEMAHGIALPAHVYPLFENAYGAHKGRSLAAHAQALGALMARFTQVAAQNPHAAMPVVRSAHALITPSADNRMIAYPYTKYLNAHLYVDQAASIVVMAEECADDLGIAHSQRVYLHASADTVDKYYVSERVNYFSSPAIRAGADQALGQSGLSLAEIDYFDLYSCFPSAVEIAADAMGLAHDDPRGLTLTGGLPYFGGPGNNYTLHALVALAARLCADKAQGEGAQRYGLVSGNGLYLTKHSFGIYGTHPPKTPWRYDNPKTVQAALDALPSPPLTLTPTGPGVIETFTIVYDKGAPAYAPVIARQCVDGARFLCVLEAREDLERLLHDAWEQGQVMPTTCEGRTTARLL